MKKSFIILLLTFVVIFGVFASGNKDETVVNLGYTMPTTSSYNLDDAEDYAKQISNGMDIGFRTYDSGLFGTYIGFDVLWPYKTTSYYGDNELGSTKFDDLYDKTTAFDMQIGIYSPLLDLGFMKLPFGAGIHGALLIRENEGEFLVPAVKNTVLDLGFSAWIKAEINLNKTIALYAGLDFSYDLYSFAWNKVGSKDPTNTQDKIKKIEIAPSLGVAIKF